MSTAAAVAVSELRVKAHRESLLKRVWASGNGRVGMIIVAVVVLIALLALVGLTPYGPTEQHPSDRFTAPSGHYWLGTDQFGRDIASRVMEGVKSSMRVALVSVAIAATVGTLAGIVAGFFGGWTDRIIGRGTDILFAFPAILLALAIVSALGSGWMNTAMAIAVVYTPIFVRVARAPVLAVREMDYVRAGRVLGYGSRRLLFRHVLPNISAPVIVQVALALSWAILTETTLSFLGLGTQPPNASLGLMVAEGRTLVAEGWWLLVPPSAAIIVAVVGLNLLGDGLRDALDPTRSGS
jgi:peptide/nickel transport system permease protein